MDELITRGGQRVQGIWVEHDRWLVAEDGPYTLERQNGVYYIRSNYGKVQDLRVGSITRSLGVYPDDEEATGVWMDEVARLKEQSRRRRFWKGVE